MIWDRRKAYEKVDLSHSAPGPLRSAAFYLRGAMSRTPMLAPFWAGVSSDDIILGSFTSLSGALVATSSSAILNVTKVKP